MGVLVGDPIYFTVLKHLYHFKTEILFKDLQNNFYTKKNFVGAPTSPPLYARPYFSLIKSLAGMRTPPLSDNVQNFVVFFIDISGCVCG